MQLRESVRIQSQDPHTGYWRTMSVTVSSNEQIVFTRMAEIKRMYPERQVRAIDGRGELLQLM